GERDGEASVIRVAEALREEGPEAAHHHQGARAIVRERDDRRPAVVGERERFIAGGERGPAIERDPSRRRVRGWPPREAVRAGGGRTAVAGVERSRERPP